MIKKLLILLGVFFCFIDATSQDLNQFKGSEKKTQEKVQSVISKPSVAPPKKTTIKEKHIRAPLDSAAATITTENENNGNAAIKSDGLAHVNFSTNSKCELFVNGISKGIINVGGYLEIKLEPGTYNIEAVSTENNMDKYSTSYTFESDPENKEIPFAIRLTEIIESRNINEQKEKERLDKEVEDAKRIAAEETPEKLLLKATLNEISANMVSISGGSFNMGSSSGNNDEIPVHSVSVGSFYAGKFEVRQSQWKTIMGSNSSYFSNCNDCPVENVSWNEAMDFIQKLNSLANTKYRLLTEAEWEYIARGGSADNNYAYSGSNTIKNVGWSFENAGGKSHPVGGLAKNNFGIADLTGNVAEWCSDWYNSSYNKNLNYNPTGPASGKSKVLRGGSWDDNDGGCRNTCRDNLDPNKRKRTIGFRLAK